MEPQPQPTYVYPSSSHFDAPPAYTEASGAVYTPNNVQNGQVVYVVVPQNQMALQAGNARARRIFCTIFFIILFISVFVPIIIFAIA
ncbi:DUF4887 domain-containing protein [Caenorhabditis elegans]|uniref:DUF4887 domain-containing protein n=1 Tax=Caenorhabditis elegans TaxID=6239 RepID=Q21331_CAEEL|nr:DUF4887 domain-containing protein [Caenorhabditis elegans]CAA97436.3 DUF4887 domain-containing protein [Caenorhabditis elegans]|eukprot:NP_502458.3 Uncharacterized protein CELE_K08D8.1 [Caenorhabditis elegans]